MCNSVPTNVPICLGLSLSYQWHDKNVPTKDVCSALAIASKGSEGIGDLTVSLESNSYFSISAAEYLHILPVIGDKI